MTEPFKSGFISKCAEFGFDGSSLLKEAQEEKPSFTDTYGGRTLLSAGIGSLAGLLYEAVKSKEKKKYWLRSALNGALGGAAAGALSLANKRNVLDVFRNPEDVMESAKRDKASAERRFENARRLYHDSLPKLPPLPEPDQYEEPLADLGIYLDESRRPAIVKTPTQRRQTALDEAEQRIVDAKNRLWRNGSWDSAGQRDWRTAKSDYERRNSRPMSFWEE